MQGIFKGSHSRVSFILSFMGISMALGAISVSASALQASCMQTTTVTQISTVTVTWVQTLSPRAVNAVTSILPCSASTPSPTCTAALVQNPDFEVNNAHWTMSVSQIQGLAPIPTPPLTQFVNSKSPLGVVGAAVAAEHGVGQAYFLALSLTPIYALTPIQLCAGMTYTLSAWVRVVQTPANQWPGQCTLVLENLAHDGWYQSPPGIVENTWVQYTATVKASGAKVDAVQIMVLCDWNTNVFMDWIQILPA